MTPLFMFSHLTQALSPNTYQTPVPITANTHQNGLYEQRRESIGKLICICLYIQMSSTSGINDMSNTANDRMSSGVSHDNRDRTGLSDTGLNSSTGHHITPDTNTMGSSGMNPLSSSGMTSTGSSGVNTMGSSGMNTMTGNRMASSTTDSTFSNQINRPGQNTGSRINDPSMDNVSGHRDPMTQGSSLPGMGGAGGLNDHPGTSRHNAATGMTDSSVGSSTHGNSHTHTHTHEHENPNHSMLPCSFHHLYRHTDFDTEESKMGQMMGKAQEGMGKVLNKPEMMAKGQEKRMAAGDSTVNTNTTNTTNTTY